MKRMLEFSHAFMALESRIPDEKQCQTSKAVIMFDMQVKPDVECRRY
jgi:hypothetical protein